MTFLTQVPLKIDLLQSLQEVADEQGLSLENVLDELVRQYIYRARRGKIEQENQSFARIHAELKQHYYRQHVAIHNGQLVDHDSSLDELVKRVKTKFGRIPVLIAVVGFR